MGEVIPAWVAVVMSALALTLGVFGSHATLGNKITQALTMLEDLSRRVGNNEAKIQAIATDDLHFHRRASDG